MFANMNQNMKDNIQSLNRRRKICPKSKYVDLLEKKNHFENAKTF